MNTKKLYPTLLFTLLFVVACAQTAPGTATTIDTTTSTTAAASPKDASVNLISQPKSTPTPLPQATPGPQPQATLPAQAQSICTDSASFVADVTIPDNTNISQGATFLKTWRIRNTGTCSWDENYSMVFVNGDQMNSIAAIPFKTTAPGTTLDLSVDLVAPSAGGAYTGYYELHNATGQLFLIDNTRTIWVKITVGKGATQQPISAASSNTGTNAATTGSAGTCTFTEDSSVENDLVNQVNAARAEYGLPALKRNSKLSAAALSHSVDMACHSFIDHGGSDGSTITGRMAAYGYSYAYWNEAIYAQPPQYGGNAQAAVTWWLNDPSHRVIILSADAKDIGPGYAYVAGSTLGGYFTIDVASPAP